MSSRITNKGIIAKLAIVFLLYGVLLFGSAGSLAWLEAWLFLIIHLTWTIPVVMWLKKNNPKLLEERMSFFKKPVKSWDKIIIIMVIILFVDMFLVAGFDAVRYHRSQIPFVLKIFGFACFIPSFALFFLVMRENTYLSTIVEIQKDRGHKVITTGPYKYVRHPMYVGAIIFFFCIPLALGSLYALIPSLLLVILIIIRTSFEDKMLHKELEGYTEYAKRVKYRLFPKVW